MQVGDGGGIAATEARQHGSLGQPLGIERFVQLGAEGVTFLGARRSRVAAVAGGTANVGDRQRRLRVALPHFLAKACVIAHQPTPSLSTRIDMLTD